MASDLWRAALAYVVATLVVFGFSVAFSNSSMYDPFWSVAPPALLVFWASEWGLSPRLWAVGTLVSVWGLRLTYNFFRGFRDLSHRDWRYEDLRAQHGRAFWLVSFFGIHFFPSALTFAGSVAIYVVASAPEGALGPLDAVAAAVTAIGIAYETVADEQLRAFVRSNPEKGRWLETGLWKHSRHPNYFGEVTFWFGLGLFALSAAPEAWWALGGAVAIAALFLFVSIPLIDARMLARRPGYATHMSRVSRLVPFFRSE